MDINIRQLPATLLETGTETQITIAEVIGDIDGSTAPSVQAEILPLTVPGARLILDMTQVPYMSSAGLRILLSVYRQVVANQGKIVLVGVAEEIQDTMSITGFIQFFTLAPTIEQSLEALKATQIAASTLK